MTPHLKRWVTGLVAVPLLFALIAFGSEEIFAILIIAASLIGVWEYNRMAFGAESGREKVETMTIALLILLTAASGNILLLVPVMTFSIMTVLILQLPRIRSGSQDMTSVGRIALGLLYIPLLMAHFILVRQTPQGVRWIFFILVLAFAGDIAAYYVGRRFGRKKLLPEVSPGKTVEGMLGLIGGSIAGCLVFRHYFFPLLPVVHAIVLGLVGSIVGQLGDLCESALKRGAGVKDSGTLLPGHGGILDRLDCLMFITPYVYYYQVLIIR